MYQQQNEKFEARGADEDEEPLVVVPTERLQKLKHSEKLRPFLSHSKLRKIIRQIDSAKNRKLSLKKLTETDEDF